MADAWHYVDAMGQPAGPVTREELQGLLLDGRLRPDAAVWTEGMPQWAPAAQVPDLVPPGLAPVPPPLPAGIPQAPTLAYAAVGTRRQAKALSHARQNCVVMFVLLIVFVLGMVVMLAAAATGGPIAPKVAGFLGCFLWMVPIAGIFAAIYLPARWQLLKEIERGYRTLGLIGGIGLIAIVVLGLLGTLGAALRSGSMIP